MSKNVWMVRAGESGYLIEAFKKGSVSIGWSNLGDLGKLDLPALKKLYAEKYSKEGPGKQQNAVSVIWRFSHVIKVGDTVVTYDPTGRLYHMGEVIGDYAYEPKGGTEHPHTRKVKWTAAAPRDLLDVATRNSLGSTLTLFAISSEVFSDLKEAASGKKEPEPAGGLTDKREELQQSNKDAAQEAKQLIEDKILGLDDYGMQELIAGILRAMGYKTRVSPRGPDRGVDVMASPDGLGLQEPRIKVEVKHRPGSPMGSQDVRSFLGSLRSGDKGLYVSSGGFSKEAKYEAERANIPVTLIDLQELALLVTEHYDNFDARGRALLPLVRIYRPAD
jgi:restriction system protein